MVVQDVLRSQYRAALKMLEQVVAACPDKLWLDDPATANPFWQVAFHALFYTHLYLQPSLEDFRRVEWQRSESHRLGEGPAPEDPAAVGEPYTKAQILDYLEQCRREVDTQLATVDLHGPSGFEWLPMTKLELQIYTIRHVQEHAGELAGRLADRAGIETGWVGMG